jgi:hypothetical protein
LIDWVTHNITFQTKEDGSMSIEPLSSTILHTPHELSVSLPNPAIAGSPTALLPPDLPPSTKLHAAAASIPVSFICASVLAFLSCLPSAHPQSIVRSGVIEPNTSSTFTMSTTPTTHHEDDALATEFDGLRPQIPRDYHDYLDVFSKRKGTTLPLRQLHDHHINLMDNMTPPFGLIYSLSKVEQLTLREFLDDNLKNQFIHPSQSSTGTPILFIKKKNGSLRLAVNYHGLNKITKKDRYPLPLIPDLLDHLCSAHIYTKLNLHGMYNLVCIADGDKWKTAFCTQYSLYEFQVMHYGLTNAPASFQCFMNEVFKELLDVCVVVYLDDILIYSDNPADHLQHVHEVLRRLRDAMESIAGEDPRSI